MTRWQNMFYSDAGEAKERVRGERRDMTIIFPRYDKGSPCRARRNEIITVVTYEIIVIIELRMKLLDVNIYLSRNCP